ncbi:MAG: DUF6090 family protein [Polaribacter sp.]|nr:DUF6090 family protein [Polaribacter sp.]
MIKFFRKIRQRLLTENKFSKYLIYAIGEIILVVIGIFLAIQLNNLNENRKERDREFTFLVRLKDDINSDITDLSLNDSIAASSESSSSKALEVFYKSKTVEDILTTDSLFKFTWTNIIVNRKTYDEMLNTSGIYILKNKKLRNQLTDYYTLIETFQQFIREMNSDSQLLRKNENLNAHNFLIKEHGKPWINSKKIDTTWIGDFNSPTMLALHKFYNHAQGALNISRQRMLKAIIEKSNLLVADIEKELKSKNYKE